MLCANCRLESSTVPHCETTSIFILGEKYGPKYERWYLTYQNPHHPARPPPSTNLAGVDPVSRKSCGWQSSYLQAGITVNCRAFKLLGVYFDENLNFDLQIKTICKKINRSLYCINKAKHFITVV
jgi:hypothetical protein